jgi:hypothetical protein
MRFILPRACSAWACVILFACDGDPVDVTAPPEEPCSDCVGCQGWREESCAYARRCEMASAHCQKQYAAIQCRSETVAQDCAVDLHGARCGEAPSECGAAQIADDVAAKRGCMQYREAACASATRCGFASNSEVCLQKPALDCASAVGLAPSFAQCLRELPSVDCQFWLPPDSCLGVVITDAP